MQVAAGENMKNLIKISLKAVLIGFIAVSFALSSDNSADNKEKAKAGSGIPGFDREKLKELKEKNPEKFAELMKKLREKLYFKR